MNTLNQINVRQNFLGKKTDKKRKSLVSFFNFKHTEKNQVATGTQNLNPRCKRQIGANAILRPIEKEHKNYLC